MQLEMTKAEYREIDAIHSTALIKFYEAPDVLLMKPVEKAYFNFGKAFETALEDVMSGSDCFDNKYFEVDTDISVPEKIYQIIDKKDNPDDYYVHNKNGSFSKTCSSLHFWLDKIIENPGKKPINAIESCMIDRMLNNFYQMEIELFGKIYELGELLSIAEFQVPIVWEDPRNGQKKKALFDAIVTIPTGEYAGRIIHFDFKTLADWRKFFWDYKDKYWIQDRHYSEGLREVYGDDAIRIMTFLVASKTKPYLTEAFQLHSSKIETADTMYEELVRSYWYWDKCLNRPPKGWRKQEYVSLQHKDII